MARSFEEILSSLESLPIVHPSKADVIKGWQGNQREAMNLRTMLTTVEDARTKHGRNRSYVGRLFFEYFERNIWEFTEDHLVVQRKEVQAIVDLLQPFMDVDYEATENVWREGVSTLIKIQKRLLEVAGKIVRLQRIFYTDNRLRSIRLSRSLSC